ncbi:uncharacterized protein C8Q71DRAFT_122177 [Rhodofomes roseus]|uniref:Uncharacterized protein n=1 Tax=Rhodofomes roseus TaxID=34475 RepID=A0ABQ8KC16_9APHY|nr:uncharacterized protein C8Q71DRAFT_122177 [Rhodofomes roseus]KAH9834744.1 hypothetical protein C8Q71DRAFT_122177 [Rhodofomes roseus]
MTHSEMSRLDALAHLPPALVCISQCPIVCRPGPAQDGWRPAGNVKEVVLARQLVYAAFEPDESINDSWSALDPQERCDRIGVGFRYATPYLPCVLAVSREGAGERDVDVPAAGDLPELQRGDLDVRFVKFFGFALLGVVSPFRAILLVHHLSRYASTKIAFYIVRADLYVHLMPLTRFATIIYAHSTLCAYKIHRVPTRFINVYG